MADDGQHEWFRGVDVEDLGEAGVRSVRTPHGLLAIGLADGEPFAVSGRCRHLLAQLGRGEVTEDGELECPWHGARFDVGTGRMSRGPRGLFKPTGPPLRAACATVAPLRRFPARIKDGRIEVRAGRSGGD